MAKKTTLTWDQAEELESLIGDYLDVDSFSMHSKRDIQDLLRQVGCPKVTVSVIFTRLESIASDVQNLRDDMTRDNIDAISEDLKRLDESMNKWFRVTGMPGRKPEYKWQVWS